LTELSTRIWLEEGLWNQVSTRAIAEGTTLRELIPKLLGAAVSVQAAPAAPSPGSAAQVEREAGDSAEDTGPPVIVLSDVYCCAVCGAQVKVGGLTAHMGKHVKERQAVEAERS
jgi:hypothetical protein